MCLSIRYDPTAAVSHDISTPEIRVDFITIVAQVIWTKAGIKLNTKKLYAADGRAVQELLKVASVLYKATQSGKSNHCTQASPVSRDDVYSIMCRRYFCLSACFYVLDNEIANFSSLCLVRSWSMYFDYSTYQLVLGVVGVRHRLGLSFPIIHQLAYIIILYP
jgi:hypothetical protein